ncbi:MAG: hypothetical protein HQM00_04520 [Magnetococcales bacterium]|nr:hypothetical protein [Magnetococcales bacterium]
MYGENAVAVVELFKNNPELLKSILDDQKALRNIWIDGMKKRTESKDSQEKYCPWGAFLGLCEQGEIDGIEAGSYSSSSEDNVNKEYALILVKLIAEKPEIRLNRNNLWKEFGKIIGKELSKNGQMDVVIALWNAGYLKKSHP